jgi:hypothetical protein
MKTRPILVTLALLVFSAVATQAGPSPDFPRQHFKTSGKAAPPRIAANRPPADTAQMPCEACKVTQLRAPRYRGPTSKGPVDWVVVGRRHACTRCGGAITTYEGKVRDEMPMNCATCRVAACCGVPAASTP